MTQNDYDIARNGVDTKTPDTSNSQSYNWWNHLAADCLVRQARSLSDQKDGATDIATAVVEACRDDINGLEAAKQDSEAAQGVLLVDIQKALDEDAKRAAVRYVVEARSYHCGPDRPPHAVGAYSPTLE